MIRIEIGRREEFRSANLIDGVYDWSVDANGLQASGRSRNPLQDACTQLQRLGVRRETQVGLFRAGHSQWDVRTTVGLGMQIPRRHAPRPIHSAPPIEDSAPDTLQTQISRRFAGPDPAAPPRASGDAEET